MLPVPRELRLVYIKLRPLILKRVPLLPNKVLKVHHELLNEHVGGGSLPLPEVLLDTVLSLLLLGDGRVHDDGAALTAHFVQKHLDALVGSLHHDVLFIVIVTARLFFGFLL